MLCAETPPPLFPLDYFEYYITIQTASIFIKAASDMRHTFRILAIVALAAVYQLLHWQIMPLGLHTVVNIVLAALAGSAAYGCFLFAKYLWRQNTALRLIAACYLIGAVFGLYFFMKFATTLDQAPMYPAYMQEAALIAGPILSLITLGLLIIDSPTNTQRRTRAG